MVEEVGPGVTDIKPGDRVAYGDGPIGAYSANPRHARRSASRSADGISDQQAAAMMLKGLTTQYLIRQIHKVRPGRRSSSFTPRRAASASSPANGRRLSARP